MSNDFDDDFLKDLYKEGTKDLDWSKIDKIIEDQDAYDKDDFKSIEDEFKYQHEILLMAYQDVVKDNVILNTCELKALVLSDGSKSENIKSLKYLFSDYLKENQSYDFEEDGFILEDNYIKDHKIGDYVITELSAKINIIDGYKYFSPLLERLNDIVPIIDFEAGYQEIDLTENENNSFIFKSYWLDDLEDLKQ